ncbi:ABC transporter permease subunit [Mycoplasmatota bacterium WC30]
MKNSEKINNSPNRKFQLRIFEELDKIRNNYLEYKNIVNSHKDLNITEINKLVAIINKEKVTLSTFYSSRKDAMNGVHHKNKLHLSVLAEDKKLANKAVAEHSRLHLVKIETVYKKMVKDYTAKSKNGDESASLELKKLEQDFRRFYSSEKINEESVVKEALLKLNSEFSKKKQQLESDKLLQIQEIEQKYNIQEFEAEKRNRKILIKNSIKEIKQLKKEMRISLKNKSDFFNEKKEEYLNQKRESNKKIQKIKLEIREYYDSLSKEEKKDYRYYQKYVNQYYRSRRKKNYDQTEKKLLKNVNAAYLYIAPAIFGVTFFTVLPFFFMIIASFFKLNLTKLTLSRFVLFDNFINAFTRDTEFQKALSNTVIYAFVTVILLSIVTVSMAAWLSKNTKIHNIAQTMIFTPHIASLVAISILWIAMLNPTGIINQGLALFGIEGPGWLIQENTSLISVSFVTVWKDIGYYVLIIISGLQSIPAYVYEAAKLDKAKKSTAFFKLTLPLLTPTLSFVFIMKFIGSFKVFAPIEIMTNGGPMGSSMVMSYWIYKVGRIGYNYGTAMVGAIVLTILISIFTVINFKYFKKQIKY